MKLPRDLVAICSPLNEGSAYMGLISKKPSKNSCDIILKVQRSCFYYSAYTPAFHSFLSSIKAFLKFIAETRLRASDREVLSVYKKGILDCSLSFRSRASVWLPFVNLVAICFPVNKGSAYVPIQFQRNPPNLLVMTLSWNGRSPAVTIQLTQLHFLISSNQLHLIVNECIVGFLGRHSWLVT